MNTPQTDPANTPAPEIQVYVLSRDHHTDMEIVGIYASQAAVEWAVVEMLRKNQDLGGLRVTPWVLIGGMPARTPSPGPRS